MSGAACVLLGWPSDELRRAISSEFPGRFCYFWSWRRHDPLCTNRRGSVPVVLAEDELTYNLAVLAGAEVVFLPRLLGLPRRVPSDLSERARWFICECGGLA